jgi:Tfp pilus assembly protein PilO
MIGSRNKKNTSLSALAPLYAKLMERAHQAGPSLSFLISMALSMGIFYVIHTYALSAWGEEVDSKRRQVEEKEEGNIKTEKLVAGEKAFLVRFNRITELYEQAKPLLPQETEVSDVLGQVETAAQMNSVKLTGLQAIKGSAESPKSEKLFEREIPAFVTGSYGNVLQFFSELSRMPRILIVRDYTITASEKQGEVAAYFTLRAFHAPPDTGKKKEEPASKKKTSAKAKK